MEEKKNEFRNFAILSFGSAQCNCTLSIRTCVPLSIPLYIYSDYYYKLEREIKSF